MVLKNIVLNKDSAELPPLHIQIHTNPKKQAFYSNH